jgi:NTP pyrophosphatase (non-canonical NTP hydrolase)
MKQETMERIRSFSAVRDWDRFHSPANLAKSIAIEAGELLECFQWDEENFDRADAEAELADVIIYCADLCDRLGVKADDIVNAKLSEEARKNPIAASKGNAIKYTKLPKEGK